MKRLSLWSYFRRGHGTYLSFFISFANFIVLQYRLLIEYMPMLTAIFSSILAFGVIFFCVYIPSAVIIGWWDYHRGAYPVDLWLVSHADPWKKDVASALKLICEQKYDEAILLLKKWEN